MILDCFKGIETEFGRAWLDSNHHYYISVKVDGRWTTKPLHKAIYERAYGPVATGMDIHHVDWNPTNNAIENLVCLTKLDHRRIHARWLKTDGEWSHKPCCACKVTKLLTEFRRSKSSYQSECKTCDNARRVKRARAKRMGAA